MIDTEHRSASTLVVSEGAGLPIMSPTDAAEITTDRKPAWERIGTPIFRESAKLDEVLKLARLDDWDVTLIPLVVVADGKRLHINSRSTVIRRENDRTHALGVVGSKYKPVQNEEVFSWTEKVAEHGHPYVCAGKLEDGAKVFLVNKIKDPIVLDGLDAVDMYMVSMTAHDGTGSMESHIFPVQRTCANTLSLSFGKSSNVWRRVRHTAQALSRMTEAKKALSHIQDYRYQFEEFASEMVDTKISHKQLRAYLKELFPYGADEGPHKQSLAKGKRQTLMELYYGSPTIDDRFRETAWAVVSAVAEYVDWYSQVRNAEGDPDHARAVRCLTSKSYEEFKENAVILLRRMLAAE
jgi:phage/plasmid-like protein (TIGR03299 family)